MWPLGDLIGIVVGTVAGAATEPPGPPPRQTTDPVPVTRMVQPVIPQTRTTIQPEKHFEVPSHVQGR